MATKAKVKTKKAVKTASKKVTKTTNVVKKINTDLVNASSAAIENTVANGEKWQKLASKLIKKSEPVREKQINMVFETAEAVKEQVSNGSKRMQNLVGYDAAVVEKALNFATNNPVSKKVIDMAEGITKKVSENPVVIKAERTTADLKTKGMAKYNEVKGEVLNKASKIINKTENKLEDVNADLKKEAKKATKKGAKTNPKTTTKAVKTKGAAKVKVAKATTNAKATKAKAKVEIKKANKEVTPKQAKKETTKKVADVKAKGATKVAAVKAETKVTLKTTAKDDLKLIYGVGPKTEMLFNDNGINTYADFNKTDAAKIEEMLEKSGAAINTTEVADWKKQAEVAVKDGAEGLEKWVARYRTA